MPGLLMEAELDSERSIANLQPVSQSAASPRFPFADFSDVHCSILHLTTSTQIDDRSPWEILGLSNQALFGRNGVLLRSGQLQCPDGQLFYWDGDFPWRRYSY